MLCSPLKHGNRSNNYWGKKKVHSIEHKTQWSLNRYVKIPSAYSFSPLLDITSAYRSRTYGWCCRAHLVSALGPGASLLALDPALLGDAVLVEHVAGLLHELADGGVALAVLVGVVGGGSAVGAVSTVAGGAADA